MKRPQSILRTLVCGLSLASWAQAQQQTPVQQETPPADAPAEPATSAAAEPAAAESSEPSSRTDETPAADEAVEEESSSDESAESPASDQENAEAEDASPAEDEAEGEDSSIKLADATPPGEQEEERYHGPATLLQNDGEKLHIGGYGGVSVAGTSINQSAGVLVGGEGAVLIGHRLAIGGAGYGLASEVGGPALPAGDPTILGFGYGGAIIRYHLMSERIPVTASVGTLIGAGGLTLVRKESWGFDREYEFGEDDEAVAVFVVEPALQVNLHLTKWMRVGLTGGYRFVQGPSLQGVSDGDLQGITAGGHVQFGLF